MNYPTPHILLRAVAKASTKLLESEQDTLPGLIEEAEAANDQGQADYLGRVLERVERELEARDLDESDPAHYDRIPEERTR